MKHSFLAAALIILGAGFLVNRSTPAVHAQSGCSVSTFSGNYGYHFTGIVYDNQYNQYFLQVVGRLVADGNGNITSGLDSGSNDGVPFSNRAFTGTYTVNADCTGTSVFSFANGKANNAFVLVSGGKEAEFTQTDPAFIFGGVAKQQ